MEFCQYEEACRKLNPKINGGGGKKLKEAAKEIESDRDYGNHGSILLKKKKDGNNACYLFRKCLS